MRSTSWPAERQFGLLIGSILLALGSISAYRGHRGMAGPSLVVGLWLVAAGALAPHLLVVPNRYWLHLSNALSWVMTRVILTLVFLFAVLPIGILSRAFGRDPLRRRSERADTYWTPYSQRQRDSKHYEHMF